MNVLLDSHLWAATLSMAVPLVLPALGGMFSERTGVINMTMEGIMLIAAFFAVLFAYLTGNAWIGLLGAMFMGGLCSLVFAFAAIRLSANQVVLGMAINLFALGLTTFLYNTIYGVGGTPIETPSLPHVNLTWLQAIPFVGGVFANQSVIVYLMLLIVAGSHWFLFHTKLGLRMRAVGENPQATELAGINVWKLRYAGVLMGGLLSSLGGAYLSIGILNLFDVNMTSGRGFIALAAMIFGRWTPLGSLGSSLLFGLATALGIALQGHGVSASLLEMLPYLLTVLAICGLVGRSAPPAALGLPYYKK
ncbi:ABC transporter permease [Paenibacillus alginolyticus]|uniref:ABC transporter permease n=1 Tax=Paenibacillus alginolyticus TaxID=59839 RepID=A0ABT4GAI8_9BACL|nr:ABC transporter permease [Paenibacillus alginolyticus]MCY9693193.1 ABC transporter permease [Paenibacillus alginolyticus]MEC0144512.1 ABC transporter permease [Paenibacillus alginolyticus]